MANYATILFSAERPALAPRVQSLRPFGMTLGLRSLMFCAALLSIKITMRWEELLR